MWDFLCFAGTHFNLRLGKIEYQKKKNTGLHGLLGEQQADVEHVFS